MITNCLHPGVINTKLLKKGWGGAGADTSKGAKNILNVLKINDTSGNYYMNGEKSNPADIANNKNVQNKLWDKSIEMINSLI